jgi:hypothetical protein
MHLHAGSGKVTDPELTGGPACHLQVFNEQRKLDELVAEEAAGSQQDVVTEDTIAVGALVLCARQLLLLLDARWLPLKSRLTHSRHWVTGVDTLRIACLCDRPRSHVASRRHVMPAAFHIGCLNQVSKARCLSNVMQALTEEDLEELQQLGEQLAEWQEAGLVPSDKQVTARRHG